MSRPSFLKDLPKDLIQYTLQYYEVNKLNLFLDIQEIIYARVVFTENVPSYLNSEPEVLSFRIDQFGPGSNNFKEGMDPFRYAQRRKSEMMLHDSSVARDFTRHVSTLFRDTTYKRFNCHCTSKSYKVVVKKFRGEWEIDELITSFYGCHDQIFAAVSELYIYLN